MRRALLALLFLLALPLLTAAAADPRDIAGRVVAVADGDTLTLLTAEKQQIRIRLAEIDAPEKGQPYGAKAKQALSDLCFGKPVLAVYVDTDRYGRTVARVYAGDLDVNAAMVRQGAAWVYRKYAHDPALLPLEEEARAAGRGLWALQADQRVPPWEWRQAQRAH